MARASISYAVVAVAVAVYAPFLQPYYQALGISLGAIGALVAFTSLVALFSAPTWGAIHDRLPTARFLLPLAAAIAALGALGLATVGASPVLIPSAGAFAIGMSGLSPMMDVRVLSLVGTDRTHYARVRVWGSISFIVCTPIIGWAIGENYRNLFLVLIPSVLLGGLAAMLLPGRAGAVRGASLRQAPGRVLGHLTIALFLIGALVGWTAVSAQSTFFSIYLHQIGASNEQIGWAWSIQAALEVPSMILFPQLARRFGAERLMVLGMAIMAVRQVANAVFVTPSFLIAFSLLQGAGYGLLSIGGITFVSRHAPRGTAATAQGILSGVTLSLSVIIGSGLGGLLAGWLTIRGLFAISACLGVAAIFLIALAVLPAANRPAAEGPSTGPPTLAWEPEAADET